MLGGTDIIFPAISDATALDNCVQVVRHNWSAARFEDAVTGEKFPTYSDIPFGCLRELLVYRDAQAESAWDADADSPDSPLNSMIYLILSPESVTAVLDDPGEPEMQSILDSMRIVLEMDMLSTYSEAA